MSVNKPSVLFLCTGNSCRSQMAEGWARHFYGDRFDIYSAGIEAHGMNANAIETMKQAGIDISGHSSKLVDTLAKVPLDVVITVCGHADENCPAALQGRAKVIHVGFDDPPKLAKDAATEQQAQGHYQRVRDEIRDFVRDRLPTILTSTDRAQLHEQ